MHAFGLQSPLFAGSSNLGTFFARPGHVYKVLVSTIVVLTIPATANANPTIESSSTPVVENMGIRIGGYGFREPTKATDESQSATGWQACRMNGIGVFANRSLNKSFFIEGGLDTYFTDSLVVPESTDTYDTPLDRSSVLVTVAAGARFYTDSFISPYLQLGIGVELTHVALPALALEKTQLLPLGFFGAGATMAIAEGAELGAVFRVNAMGYYDDSQFQTELSAEMELATQGQFYASFAL